MSLPDPKSFGLCRTCFNSRRESRGGACDYCGGNIDEWKENYSERERNFLFSLISSSKARRPGQRLFAKPAKGR